jgi:hypothetical protein
VLTQRSQANEPDEHVDTDEESIDPLRGHGHIEGIDAAIVLRRDVMPALEKVQNFLLEFEAVHVLRWPQPDHADGIATTEDLPIRGQRHEHAF